MWTWGHIKNCLFFNPPMKKIKGKRCKDCIYAYKRGHIFACQKSGIWIEPLRLICFKRRKNNEKK